MCTIEASNASVCEWSPDASHVLFATTSPRLRVDNGIKIFHVGGGLMYNTDMNELYDVFWRPRSGGAPAGDPLKTVPEPHASAKEVLANRQAAVQARAGAYRPPGARGQRRRRCTSRAREDEGGAAVLPTNGASGLAPGRERLRPGRAAARGARRRSRWSSCRPGAAAGGGVRPRRPARRGRRGGPQQGGAEERRRSARRARPKEAAAERDRAGRRRRRGGAVHAGAAGPRGARRPARAP